MSTVISTKPANIQAMAERLMSIGSTLPNRTTYLIGTALDTALVLFQNDGDKVSDPEARELIIKLLGYRTHSVINCNNNICVEAQNGND